MKRRLRKKLHKKYLWFIQDLSYVRNTDGRCQWRMRLMAADFFMPFRIDKRTIGNTAETRHYIWATRAVRKYDLTFKVTKLPYHEEGLAEGSYVIFRFASVEFPEIATDTCNGVDYE